MIKKLIVMMLLITSCGIGQSSSVGLDEGIKFGEYNVGYKFYRANDFSRNSSYDGLDNSVSPKQVEYGVWYPAKVSDSKSYMNYGAYLHAYVTEETPKVNAIEAFLTQTSFLGKLDQDVLRNKLEENTMVVSNAIPENGKFPILIYSSKNNGPIFENNVLFEFLASNGYYVISIPPKPTVAEWESWSLNNYEDIIFSINQFTSVHPNADLSNIVTAGYEIGGVGAIAFSNRNKNVKAHISYNGAVGSRFGWSFAKGVPYTDLKKLKIPILHIGTSDYELREVPFELIDSIPNSIKYFKYYPDVFPLSISSYYTENWAFSLENPSPKYKLDKKTAIKAYHDILQTSLEFLDIYTKHNGSEEEFKNRIERFNALSKVRN